MLISAIRDDDPTIFIEHRWLHATHGAVPEGAYEVPLDKAAVVKSGKDITIVASSFMVLESRIAASALQAAGIDVKLIDLRSVRPYRLTWRQSEALCPLQDVFSVWGYRMVEFWRWWRNYCA